MEIIKAAQTAHNRTVYVAPAVAGLGFRSFFTRVPGAPPAHLTAASRIAACAPFPRHCSGTVCQPWSCYASPYSGWQNVIYSRNVMRNKNPIYQKIFERRHPCRR